MDINTYCFSRFWFGFDFCVLDYLQQSASGSTLYGFKGGPAGIMKGKYVELNSDYIYPYRNQVFLECNCIWLAEFFEI
jgi:uncharacterized protein (DUF2147 family)